MKAKKRHKQGAVQSAPAKYLPEQTAYRNYEKHFTPAIEASFANIKWANISHISETEPQTITLKLDSSHWLILIVAILEKETENYCSNCMHVKANCECEKFGGQFVYLWQVLTYIVVGASNTIKLESQWGRRERSAIRTMTNALLLHSGQGRPSSMVKNNIRVTTKMLNEYDLKVVEVARERRKISDRTAILGSNTG